MHPDERTDLILVEVQDAKDRQDLARTTALATRRAAIPQDGDRALVGLALAFRRDLVTDDLPLFLAAAPALSTVAEATAWTGRVIAGGKA